MKTALLVISTGQSYWQYTKPLIESAKKFFVPHQVLLFTDSPENYGVCQVHQPNLGFPETTLKRYHIFLTQKEWLRQFDYAFYIDVDAIFVDYVGSEIFSGGITATLHHSQKAELESNPGSTAYLERTKYYFCGGFNGGTTSAYLKMAESLSHNISMDESRGILAKWHDESHLNRYLADNPPARILPSTYCYPEPELHIQAYNPKIVCLEKSLRGGR